MSDVKCLHRTEWAVKGINIKRNEKIDCSLTIPIEIVSLYLVLYTHGLSSKEDFFGANNTYDILQDTCVLN